jgi:hypothetical protein
MMRSGARSPGLALLGGIAALLVPLGVSAADEAPPARSGPRVQDVDVSALVTTELLPTTFFGIDAAYVVGNESFQARLGGLVAGGRAFDLGPGRVSNAMQAGQLDLCAAKSALRHRIRMCVGGQVGAMQHRWQDMRPGRRVTPYAAGTLKGDYRYAFTPRFGLLLGVGVSVPFVGPRFVNRDMLDVRTGADILPGPIAGTATVGASFSFI